MRMRVLSAEVMAAVDRDAQARRGMSGLVLMEHAALAVVRSMRQRLGALAGRPVAVFTGGGNNGGDGFAVARLLARLGAAVEVYEAVAPGALGEGARVQRDALAAFGVPTRGDPEALPEPDARAVLVDALLGTGTRGAPRPAAARWLEALGAWPGPVVALDVPSGVPPDGGAPSGPAVRADWTVCFGWPKPFAVCPVARPFAGEVEVADIGFPPPLPGDLEGATEVFGEDPPGAKRLSRRVDAAHKGEAGRVGVVAGGPGMWGAAALAAEGALRGGAGLVRLISPHPGGPEVWPGLPEVMVERGDGSFAGRLRDLAGWADSLVVGPGFGADPPGRDALVELLTASRKPVVVDADGLRLGTPGSPAGPRVYTPHPGEARRLLGVEVGAAGPERARAAAALAARAPGVWVLKGQFTRLAEGARRGVSTRGHPVMATGGSGDVLAGLLGAVLAGGGAGGLFERVGEVVAWHGAAGELLAAGGSVGGTARQLAARLPEARDRLLGRSPISGGPGRIRRTDSLL